MGWISLIGAGISALGQHNAGQDEQDAANEQAGYVQSNALAKAVRIRQLTRQAQSSATAAQAASGIDVSSGSASGIQQDIGRRGEQDAYTTLLDADINARMLRNSGRAAAAKANAQAGSTLLEGVGNYYTKGGGAEAFSGWKRSGTSGVNVSSGGVGTSSGGGDPMMGGW